MNRSLTADELGQLLHALLKPSALIELGVFVACLALAWLAVRLLRGQVAQPGSTLFGERIVDGALFPAVALLLALLARWLLRDWVPIALFKLLVPILVSLALIRLTVRVLHASFPDSALMRVVERSVSWVAWIAVVLWITGLLPLLLQELDAITWKLGGTQVSVRNMLEGAITAVLAMLLALWVSSMLESRLLTGATDNLSVRKMAANLLRLLLLFVGLMFALSAAGVDLTALGVLGGAVGVGIGFGLQKLAANYVSGFVILAERSMRIGDTVKVDNFEGRITDISTRYTVIRALNGRESIVPNEMMITQRIENASLADSKVALTTVVQVAYGTDLTVLLPRIVQAVSEVPRVIDAPGPAALLTNFAADGLELTITFWIADPEKGQSPARSDVNLALLALFNAMGVEIPFPQRVIHPLASVPALPAGAAAAPGLAAAPPSPAGGPTPAR
jgi:small-conductance mechanosensitive channel